MKTKVKNFIKKITIIAMIVSIAGLIALTAFRPVLTASTPPENRYDGSGLHTPKYIQPILIETPEIFNGIADIPENQFTLIKTNWKNSFSNFYHYYLAQKNSKEYILTTTKIINKIADKLEETDAWDRNFQIFTAELEQAQAGLEKVLLINSEFKQNLFLSIFSFFENLLIIKNSEHWLNPAIRQQSDFYKILIQTASRELELTNHQRLQLMDLMPDFDYVDAETMELLISYVADQKHGFALVLWQIKKTTSISIKRQKITDALDRLTEFETETNDNAALSTNDLLYIRKELNKALIMLDFDVNLRLLNEATATRDELDTQLRKLTKDFDANLLLLIDEITRREGLTTELSELNADYEENQRLLSEKITEQIALDERLSELSDNFETSQQELTDEITRREGLITELSELTNEYHDDLLIFRGQITDQSELNQRLSQLTIDFNDNSRLLTAEIEKTEGLTTELSELNADYEENQRLLIIEQQTRQRLSNELNQLTQNFDANLLLLNNEITASRSLNDRLTQLSLDYQADQRRLENEIETRRELDDELSQLASDYADNQQLLIAEIEKRGFLTDELNNLNSDYVNNQRLLDEEIENNAELTEDYEDLVADVQRQIEDNEEDLLNEIKQAQIDKWNIRSRQFYRALKFHGEIAIGGGIQNWGLDRRDIGTVKLFMKGAMDLSRVISYKNTGIGRVYGVASDSDFQNSWGWSGTKRHTYWKHRYPMAWDRGVGINTGSFARSGATPYQAVSTILNQWKKTIVSLSTILINVFNDRDVNYAFGNDNYQADYLWDLEDVYKDNTSHQWLNNLKTEFRNKFNECENLSDVADVFYDLFTNHGVKFMKNSTGTGWHLD